MSPLVTRRSLKRIQGNWTSSQHGILIVVSTIQCPSNQPRFKPEYSEGIEGIEQFVDQTCLSALFTIGIWSISESMEAVTHYKRRQR